MPGVLLSPDICSKIVLCSSIKRRDLAALCLTCKAFQREAEIKLYENLVFTEPQNTYLACRALTTQERLGPLVRTFCFNQESQRTPVLLGDIFWITMQEALTRMHNVEEMIMTDSSFSNSWIFDSALIKFQLREAKLRFAWDADLIRFLEGQHKLLSLQIADPFSDRIEFGIRANHLPALRSFDGPLTIGVQLAACPLTHLQLSIDTEASLSQLFVNLPKLAQAYGTLRGLNIQNVPEDLCAKALGIISKACPLLRHVGLFPLPCLNRHRFHHPLIQMHDLRSIELDISHWNPQPDSAGQRVLASELRIFCPSIKSVIFWSGSTKFRWTMGNEWQSRVDTHQYPLLSTSWSKA